MKLFVHYEGTPKFTLQLTESEFVQTVQQIIEVKIILLNFIHISIKTFIGAYEKTHGQQKKLLPSNVFLTKEE